MADDKGHFPVGMHHLLVMTPALHWASWPYFSGHEAEDAVGTPGLFSLELNEVLFDEVDVFDSLIEIPHSLFVISFLSMALPNIIDFLSLNKQKGSTCLIHDLIWYSLT